MSDDELRLDEQFYIVSDASRTDSPTRVMKHGDSFGVFDPHGDVIPADGGEQGLYHDGTRFLSRFELLFGRRRPLLLSSTISADNTLLVGGSDEPGRPARWPHRRPARRGPCVPRPRAAGRHLCRSASGALQSRAAPDSSSLLLSASTPTSPMCSKFVALGGSTAELNRRMQHRGDITFRYVGLDVEVERRTRLSWSRQPSRVDDGTLVFLLALASHETTDFEVQVSCEGGPRMPAGCLTRVGGGLGQAESRATRRNVNRRSSSSSNQELIFALDSA